MFYIYSIAMSDMNKIYGNKEFAPYIGIKEIATIVKDTADKINTHYKNIVTEENPLIIVGILNGSFMFLSDLVKQIDLHCQIHFIKVTSYEGTETTGKITKLIGLNENIKNLNVLIVEDIIDTGITINNIIDTLDKEEPASLNICTVLYKKEKYISKPINIEFVGKEIPDKFVIGYGLDYNKSGRQLEMIYALK